MEMTIGNAREIRFWSLLAVIPVLLCTAVLHTPTRSRLREAWSPDYRTVVSQARAALAGTKDNILVLKIRTRDSLSVEIYRMTENEREGLPSLIERIVLDQNKDGHFNFHGRMTNLALADLDGDLQPEILVPAFDDALSAHLNIFKYDPSTKSFYRASSSEFDSLAKATWPVPRTPSYKRMLASVQSSN